jgi:hypothetical protein
MAAFRGAPLTHEVAEDLLIGWLAEPSSSLAAGRPGADATSWLVFAGKNPGAHFIIIIYSFFFFLYRCRLRVVLNRFPTASPSTHYPSPAATLSLRRLPKPAAALLPRQVAWQRLVPGARFLLPGAPAPALPCPPTACRLHAFF